LQRDSSDAGRHARYAGLGDHRQSLGKGFENASIKLMAGDVSKINPNQPRNGAGMGGAVDRLQIYGRLAGPSVTEKTFDDYHLYSLARQVTLHNRETKQVE